MQEVIENLVGTKINDISLYMRAFTHKSYNKELHYERLEFIGDSVIKFIVTKYLFEKFPHEDEGFLTRARTKIERSETLAGFARTLGFHEYILMDEKGLRNAWNTNSKILEDVFEAFIGAIYLDKGMVYARDFVLNVLNTHHVSFDDDNYKDQIMRFCQAHKYDPPVYTTESKNNIFETMLYINNRYMGKGYGKTKKMSEQEAAKMSIKVNRLSIPIHASKS